MIAKLIRVAFGCGAVVLLFDGTAFAQVAVPGTMASPIASNFHFEIPLNLAVSRPCRPGLVLVNTTLAVEVKTLTGADFQIQLKASGTGEGIDVDANGVPIVTGNLPYEYSAEASSTAVFADGRPNLFAPTFALTGEFVRSQTDQFVLTADLEMTFTNGIPTVPVLVSLDIACP